jgi:hypothetical protein
MKWFKVYVVWDDIDLRDEIQGENARDALRNAWQNWQDARRIEILG